MKKPIILVLFALLVAAIGMAQKENAEQEVLNLAKRKFVWMIAKQTDSLANILDDSLKYIHSNGWVQTKKDMVADLVSNKISYEQVTISEAATRKYENTIIVIAKGKFVGKINNTPFALDLLFTEVYIRNHKNWLLASRHACKM